jgi:twinkle protein
MQNEIMNLYYSNEPLCEDGRLFLVDRELDIPEAIKAGVRSLNGNIYFFFTLNGEPVRWKSRSMEDKKVQRFNKVENDDAKDSGIPFFSQFKDPRSDDLIITEGEFDCVALRQLGASNVVSLPNGAGSVEKSFKFNYEFLQQFSRIFIAFDMDKSGDEAAKKAMTLLKPSKYRRIFFPCKDANDWVRKYKPLDINDLNTLMENARRVDDPVFTDGAEVPESFFEKIDIGISSGWYDLDRILGGIRKGEITVITADTGVGKSTFCLNLFKNLAENKKGVWLNSFEMSPKITYRKLACMVLKKKMKFGDFTAEDKDKFLNWMKQRNCKFNIANTSTDIEKLRVYFETATLAYGLNYILLDHLDYIFANGKKKTNLENIDETMRELHVLALEYDVGIILVAHPKQVDDTHELTLSDLKGSSSIKQYADNVIIVSRMDKIDKKDNRVKVNVVKNRMCGKNDFFYLKYLYESDSYEESII